MRSTVLNAIDLQRSPKKTPHLLSDIITITFKRINLIQSHERPLTEEQTNTRIYRIAVNCGRRVQPVIQLMTLLTFTTMRKWYG